MADISAFPDLEDMLDGDLSLIQSDRGPIQQFTFAADTKAGQVVVFGATDGEVTPATGSITEKVAGVALDDYSDDDIGAVAMNGCIVMVTNASGSVAIAQGVWIKTDDNAVLGTVSAIDLTASGATATQYLNVVGITMPGGIPAAGSGYALILNFPITVPNAS